MATVVQRPTGSTAEPTPQAPARVQAVGTGAHVEHVAEETPPPRLLESLALFVIAAALYFWIGYQTVIDNGVVVFDALDRLTRAYMVWHNDPPKLAAVGFVFPPLTTMVFLPFTVLKPLATSLVALPLVSALFGGGMVVAMNRLLARCSMVPLHRWTVVVLFALNPLLVFYAGNGMSEVVHLALLTFVMYCIASWFITAQPRFVVAAGLTFALLVLLRYTFGVWTLVIALLLAIGLTRRGARSDETEGTLVTFLAPLVYALGVWVLFNVLIVGDVFGWLSGSGALAVNAPGAGATGDVSLGDVLGRLAQLALGVFALGVVVVPALIVTAISRRDELSWWLVVLIVTGIVMLGAGALIDEDFDALALRNALPILILCVAGGAWLYRVLPDLRLVVWVGLLAGLLLTAISSWQAMNRYPFQSQEQAFVRALQGGGDQDGSNSIGGYSVGTEAEEVMASYINANVRGRSTILTDNAQTFGVILLSGRPQLFFDRVDEGDAAFEQVALRPHGRVSHLLMAKQVSGDLVRRRYPSSGSRVAAGLEPVLETTRYLLLSVPDRDPRSRSAAAGAGGGAPGGAQVGGQASGAVGSTGGAASP